MTSRYSEGSLFHVYTILDSYSKSIMLDLGLGCGLGLRIRIQIRIKIRIKVRVRVNVRNNKLLQNNKINPCRNTRYFNCLKIVI